MTLSEIDAVVSEIRVAAAPHAVFAFFVDADKMVRWMGEHAVADPRPSGVYAIDINPRARARGEYLEVVPHSRVVFSFGWEDDDVVPPGSSTVEVTLTPDGDGTHVRLVHRGLLTPAMRDQHRDGWLHYLARLGVVVSGGAPGLDPNANPPREENRP
ncbi:MAG TPA: SRPBCC domain-containing protein [Chloroflexota bacterium]